MLKKCVVAIARNENDYIVEWLNHYKSLGFAKAVVFDNNDRKGTRQIVESAGLSEFCEVDERYIGVRSFVQLKAYAEAFKEHRPQFDWFGFFDIDEFLDVDGGDVDGFLQNPRYRQFDAIRMHWKVFGDCGNVRSDGRPVVERFKEPLPMGFPENMECKSFIRGTAQPTKFSCHGAKGVRACDTLGRPCESFWERNSGPVVWDFARVNHYRTKTIEEFLKCKYARGDTWNKFSNKIEEFFRINERTKEKMDAMNEYLGKNRTAMDDALVRDAVAFTKGYVHGDFVNNPRTIQEKIAHIKIFKVTDAMTVCADKIKVKEYVKDMLGVDLCVPILSVYRTAEEINFSKLPGRFALKCNHGSHFNIIVKNKANVNETWAKSTIRKWLATDYSLKGYELQYRNIPRMAFAEEYVGDGNDTVDYKFICFNGKPTFCQVASMSGTKEQRMNYYDMDFKFMDICRTDFIRNNPEKLDSPPKSFELMKGYAAKLSAPFDFVRVDFFELDGKPYLGEMTFTPANARQKYTGDPETSLYLGNMLTLTK